MKELAIIGSSNSLMKGGYGEMLKNKYGDDCDRYVIGGSTSLFVIYNLLKYKIIDSYKTVVIQTNIIESGGLEVGYLDRYTLITYLDYIIKLISNCNTNFIFLLSPRTDIEYCSGCSYIYLAFEKLYNINILNMEKEFLYVSKDDFAADNAHSSELYQKQIYNRVLENIKNTKKINKCNNDLEFYIINCKEIFNNSPTIEKGSSILKLPVIELTPSMSVSLPNDKYLCGMFYFIEPGYAFVSIENIAVNFVSRLHVKDVANMFFSTNLGYSINDGLKGGLLSITYNTSGKYIERSWPGTSGKTFEITNYAKVYLESLIFCNQSIRQYGINFYFSHRSLFIDSHTEIYGEYIKWEKNNKEKIFNKFDEVVEYGSDYARFIFKKRPDLYKVVRNIENIVPEVLLWSWSNGADESEEIKIWMPIISQGIKKLHSVQANITCLYHECLSGYTQLIHSIWIQRDDLKQFNPLNKDGQESLIAWFNEFGKNEYNLNKLL